MALPMSITAQVDPDFKRRLSPQQFTQGIHRGLRRGVFAVQRRAKLNLTGRFLRVRTNRLRSSLVQTIEVRGNEFVGIVGTNVFYGRIHEFGAPGPWEIRPVRAKALRFVAGGRVVFAMQVTHPGLPERPWLRTALQESRADIERALRVEFERHFEKAR